MRLYRGRNRNDCPFIALTKSMYDLDTIRVTLGKWSAWELSPYSIAIGRIWIDLNIPALTHKDLTRMVFQPEWPSGSNPVFNIDQGTWSVDGKDGMRAPSILHHPIYIRGKWYWKK